MAKAEKAVAMATAVAEMAVAATAVTAAAAVAVTEAWVPMVAAGVVVGKEAAVEAVERKAALAGGG